MTATKHDDTKNKDNPHSQNDLESLGIKEEDRAQFARLMGEGKTVEDAKALIEAAKKSGKVKSTGAIGGATDPEVDPVREGSKDLALRGVKATEAEIETGQRKPVGEDKTNKDKHHGKK